MVHQGPWHAAGFKLQASGYLGQAASVDPEAASHKLATFK